MFLYSFLINIYLLQQYWALTEEPFYIDTMFQKFALSALVATVRSNTISMQYVLGLMTTVAFDHTHKTVASYDRTI